MQTGNSGELRELSVLTMFSKSPRPIIVNHGKVDVSYFPTWFNDKLKERKETIIVPPILWEFVDKQKELNRFLAYTESLQGECIKTTLYNCTKRDAMSTLFEKCFTKEHLESNKRASSLHITAGVASLHSFIENMITGMTFSFSLFKYNICDGWLLLPPRLPPEVVETIFNNFFEALDKNCEGPECDPKKMDYLTKYYGTSPGLRILLMREATALVMAQFLNRCWLAPLREEYPKFCLDHFIETMSIKKIDYSCTFVYTEQFDKLCNYLTKPEAINNNHFKELMIQVGYRELAYQSYLIEKKKETDQKLKYYNFCNWYPALLKDEILKKDFESYIQNIHPEYNSQKMVSDFFSNHPNRGNLEMLPVMADEALEFLKKSDYIRQAKNMYNNERYYIENPPELRHKLTDYDLMDFYEIKQKYFLNDYADPVQTYRITPTYYSTQMFSWIEDKYKYKKN